MSVFIPEVFRTSRLLDFLGQRELTRQIGHTPEQWPLVVVKELTDNALDDSEEAGLPPSITVTVTRRIIEVRDFGSGIPAETVTNVLDFSSRISSRAAYAGPTRGAQGNALKTIVAMGFALDDKAGLVEIEARGIHHRIRIAADPIAQQPMVDHHQGPSAIRNGTLVRVWWPDLPWRMPLEEIRDFLPRFAVFNPHLHLTITIDDDEPVTFEPTDPTWQRWRASNSPPIHWYDADRFGRLIASTIHADRSAGKRVRYLRDFVGQFRGLTSTSKRKLVLSSLELPTGATMEALLDDAGQLIIGKIRVLHNAMLGERKGPKASDLGIIGRDHLEARLGEGAAANSFDYRKFIDGDDTISPWIFEACFAWLPRRRKRLLEVGLNHSPALAGGAALPVIYGYGGLDSLLSDRFCGDEQPILFAAHFVAANMTFVDTGKSRVELAVHVCYEMRGTVETITKKWHKQRTQEVRSAQAEAKRAEVFEKSPKVTIKEAAYEIMEAAYLKASGDGRRWANARQVMYAARQHILERTGETSLNDKYFTQTLLPDYIAERGFGATWKVAFDVRGFLLEPHTETEIKLGTVEVDEYIVKLQTRDCSYGACLFIEKEGFHQLFAEARLQERYDLALMSTKGTSTTSARRLVETLVAKGIRVFCIRDFDEKGFEIARTLREDTRRYVWSGGGAIDLGLRLEDVERFDLESEPVHYTKGKQLLRFEREIVAKIGDGLRQAGATDAEIAFLVRGRVELNAFTSDQLLEWIEEELVANGVEKIIPNESRLAGIAAAQVEEMLIKEHRDAVMRRIEKILAKVEANARAEAAELMPKVQGQLWEAVAGTFETERELRWDTALARIVSSRLREARHSS